MSDHSPGFHGPACWAISAVGGLAGGAVLALVVPTVYTGAGPQIPGWLVAPFAVLLACIALMPFVNARFWQHHHPDFAFALGGLVAGYYLVALRAGGHGPGHVLHAAVEYYSFIALVGGLFVVSGGFPLKVGGAGGRRPNTFRLALGASWANSAGPPGAPISLFGPFIGVRRSIR